MRKHLTYANVVATLALFIAVAGGSTAVAISAKKAPKNSVTSASIKDGSVTAKDLAATAVVTTTEGQPAVANCAGADRLLGGGAAAFDSSGSETTTFPDKLQRSEPVGNGWRAQGTSGARAYAVCLSAKPGK